MTEEHYAAGDTAEDPPGSHRLVIVSNRLPVSLRIDREQWSARRSSGGLAAALAGVAGRGSSVWVGWPGCVVPDALKQPVSEWMARDDLVPVFLSADDEELYYHGISNQVVWPLFHYFADKMEFSEAGWNAYQDVNRRFADQVLAIAAPGTRVWVHDFHLTLVPGMLRAARPDLQIGCFLHIPFPSSEIYRTLPAREQILEGLLGADYLGFHTHDYARHFRSSCLRVLGVESEHDAIPFEGRRVALGVHPIGVDVHGFDETLARPETRSVFTELCRHYAERRVILGIERLDYTKGVGLKLQAFERLLERRPDLRGEVVLLQVIVPSRLDNPEYAQLKRDLEEDIGRVNGRFGNPGYTPIEYLHRSIPPEQLASLYRLASVCMVTPIRDGMNLVAQEFELCQEERADLDDPYRGTLVLSEFAGAAQVLPRALLVNPWDIGRTAGVLEQTLEMTAAERAARGSSMAAIVRAMDCDSWARHFLARMDDAVVKSRAWFRSTRVLQRGEMDEVLAQYVASDHRILLLDYDGTLRELMRTPEEAAPTEEIRGLLTDLAADPRNQVHIVSGRHRDTLAEWLGDLPIWLSAEHGFAWRAPHDTWHELERRDLDWLPSVQERLLDVSEEVPGTRIERKPTALAWHYRMADVDYGVWRARELHSQLEQDLAHLPVEIIHGHRVIEVRAAGVSKGGYVGSVLDEVDERTFVLCMGDDRTDRDMYRALPPNAISVHVGGGDDQTRYSIPSPAKARAFLRELADAGRTPAAD
ncbi:MAG: bifunctional alpha,alpha-trehalose-phosphate synthase (UDP-forming)/trehalose-phosphatase [Planctomycetes bacterium]|nr:bifunctional alpha,alpha-trehalose-phosphate synthase (UDP-forming)/trehalose-phosphatase [Planctomycetota bacterium]